MHLKDQPADHATAIMIPAELKLTYADYLSLPPNGKRQEILDGDLVMTPAPNRKHQQVSRNIEFALILWVRAGSGGEVYNAPFDVVLSEHDIVQPDLVWYSEARRDRLQDAGGFGAPDLVVEILSESTRSIDCKTKRHIYGRTGVREYWIVDPDAETIEVFRPAKDPHRAVATFRDDDTLASDTLAGFALPLTEIFRA